MKRLSIFWLLAISSTILIGQQTDDKEFKLIQAAEQGHFTRVLKLLGQNVDPNTATWDGMTPLHFAIQNGHDKVAKTLIVNGSDIDKQDIEGRTPLHMTVHFDQLDLAEYLIQKGAKLNEKDAHGLNPLFYAAAYGDHIMTDMFLFYKGDQDIRDSQGKTPFLVAVWGGFPTVAKLLLDHGAKINETDKSDNTALHLAIENNDTICVDSLIKWGIDIQKENTKDYTALDVASFYGHSPVLQQLLRNGANPNHEIDKNYYTLDLARDGKNKQMVIPILRANGAKTTPLPAFSSFELGLHYLNRTLDPRIALYGALIDKKYNLRIKSAVTQQLTRQAVFHPVNDTLSYQFKETRTEVHLGFSKQFTLYHSSFEEHTGIEIGFFTAASFSDYKASKQYGPVRFFIYPSVALYYQVKKLYYHFGYEYISDALLPGSPHRINFGIGLQL